MSRPSHLALAQAEADIRASQQRDALRDHYAAAALTGLLAGGHKLALDKLAEAAFETANAMLDARKRLQDQPA